MKAYRLTFSIAAFTMVFAARCAPASEPGQPFPTPSELKSQETMPDPLVKLDGKRVTSRGEWFRVRRPELKALFEHYMYARHPAETQRYADQD